jgi:hypothetical protein
VNRTVRRSFESNRGSRTATAERAGSVEASDALLDPRPVLRLSSRRRSHVVGSGKSGRGPRRQGRGSASGRSGVEVRDALLPRRVVLVSHRRFPRATAFGLSYRLALRGSRSGRDSRRLLPAVTSA